MIHALLLAALLSGAAGDRHPTPRPRPAAKPAPKPPPPPIEEEEEEPLDLADPDEEPAFDEPAPAPPGLDDDDVLRPRSRRRGDYTEQQLQMIGGAALCTCFCFVVGLVALVIFLVRRSGKPAAAPAPPAGAAPPPPAPAPAAIPFHLSVVAVGMHASARQLVAQQLLVTGVQADPATAAERTQLVRELSKSVRGLETEWTHFGYGERLDLPDQAAAQQSYERAVEDFGKRSADPSLSGEAAYVVMTLVLCTRRQLRGVSALDDRAQVRTLLEERSTLAEPDLMGAYVAWSAPLGGHDVLTRFPEMHAIR